MDNTILNTVKHYISQHRLLSEDGLWLVALSGGADSVALLLMLKQLGFVVEAIHCNFHLRGEESERDERFCIDLCEKNAIPLHRIHFETREYATLHQMSIEMAARELRYRYFEQLRQDIGADGICVAHHQDDSVETILMNIIRGTGLKGLRGIQPMNGHILRPLLCLKRSDIEEYLKSIRQTYVTDSSNLVDDVIRNKLRLDILPLLRDINPSVADSITKMADYMGEVEHVVEHAMQQSLGNMTQQRGQTLIIDKSLLLQEPAPAYTLYYITNGCGFTSEQLQDILERINGEPGKVFCSASHQLLVDRETLLLEPRSQEQFKPLRVPETGRYVVNEAAVVRVSEKKRADVSEISKQPLVVMLDADKVSFPLTFRLLQSGDRFQPFGMTGSRLVSDFLTDKKLSLFEKRRQLVMTDGKGDIAWIVGHRTDNRFRVDENTQRVMVIEWIEKRK